MKLSPHNPIKYGFGKSSLPPDLTVKYNKNEGHFTPSFDSRLWMFHRRWVPPEGEKVKATLMIVHGTVDHSGVYSELAEGLAVFGIAVFAMDMRGWGLSDGERMYVDSMDTFVSDVAELYRRIHNDARYRNVTSRFLMGKSLGGAVAAFCVAEHPDKWTGLLGLSGAYELDPNMIPSPVVASLLSGFAKCMPKLPFKNLFDEKLIVSDPQALQAWRNDKLCCKDKVTLGYALQLLQACKELSSPVMMDEIDIPMLMMCGDADKVVTLSGHQRMTTESRSTDTELKIYEGGLHNLLQEPELKYHVAKDIREWILARVE